jgi:hypothetical protein
MMWESLPCFFSPFFTEILVKSNGLGYCLIFVKSLFSYPGIVWTRYGLKFYSLVTLWICCIYLWMDRGSNPLAPTISLIISGPSIFWYRRIPL